MGDAAHNTGTGWIWKIFWLLLIITTVEVVLGIIQPDFLLVQFAGTRLLNHIFIILTLVKAFYIVWSFMHVKDEKKNLQWTLFLPVIILIPYLTAIPHRRKLHQQHLILRIMQTRKNGSTTFYNGTALFGILHLCILPTKHFLLRWTMSVHAKSLRRPKVSTRVTTRFPIGNSQIRRQCSDERGHGGQDLPQFLFLLFMSYHLSHDELHLSSVFDRFDGREKFYIVSHTVDPERDSVPVLKAYAKERGYDHPQWRFVTGPKDSIYAVAENYFLNAMEDQLLPEASCTQNQ